MAPGPVVDLLVVSVGVDRNRSRKLIFPVWQQLFLGGWQYQDADHSRQTQEKREPHRGIETVGNVAEKTAEQSAGGQSVACAHHLVSVGGADWSAAVVLTIDNWERTHLATKADSEKHRKQIELPRVMGDQQ